MIKNDTSWTDEEKQKLKGLIKIIIFNEIYENKKEKTNDTKRNH